MRFVVFLEYCLILYHLSLLTCTHTHTHTHTNRYDKDPMLKKLAVELESIYEYMVSDVAPQLGERWDQQVKVCE